MINSSSIDNNTFLIIGLGNPGREYRFTRHNIGFLSIDKLAETQNIQINRVKNNTLIGLGHFNENKLILAKPQTYMNLSGKAVNSLINFYKVSLEHTLIIHDDLDLPFGSIRLRPSGSSGGQKGIHSVIQMLGTEQIPRLRVGIGRPPGRMNAMDYVLQRFNDQDSDMLDEITERVTNASLAFIEFGIEYAMNHFNQSTSSNP